MGCGFVHCIHEGIIQQKSIGKERGLIVKYSVHRQEDLVMEIR